MPFCTLCPIVCLGYFFLVMVHVGFHLHPTPIRLGLKGLLVVWIFGNKCIFILNAAIDMSYISEWEIPLVLFMEFVPCFYAGINVLCGVGILSTPYAIKQGGWVGLVILCLFALLAWYTGVLLRRCLDSKEGLETYPDIGHAAFGTTGRILISVWHHSDYK